MTVEDDQTYRAVDQSILRAIDKIRNEHGSCTAGQVAALLRIDRSTVISRCRSMLNRNMVTWTEVPGSLQRVGSRAQRLYDLTVQRAVEGVAAGEFDAEPEVKVWCEWVVGVSVAAAWPELTGGMGASDQTATDVDADGGQVDAEPEAVGAATEPPANYCEPCGKQCKTGAAFAAHRRSPKCKANVSG